MLLLRSKHPIYGVSWDKTATPTLTRTDASVGMVATAGVGTSVVRNDFDGASVFREIQEVTDTLGNAFVRIPKFYIKKTDGVGFKTWQISKTKYDGFYLPWCFWDFTNSRELPYVDVGKYKGSKASTKLQSVADAYPLINDNIVNFRTYAQNNNAGGLLGYQQMDMHVYDIIQSLFYAEFATLDSQSVMQGYTTGQYTATHVATVTEAGTNRIIVANAYADLYRVGQAISVGTSQGGNQIFYGRTITAINVYDASNKAISFDGAPVNVAAGNILYNTGWKNGFSAAIAASSGSIVSNSDGKYPCMYRGIESPWGDVWQFVDGVNINDRRAWVCANAASYASNVFAAPYEQLGYVDHNGNNYAQTMGYDASNPFAEFPTAVSAIGDSAYKDYYYQDAGQRIARVGGDWSAHANAGVSCWFLVNTSSAANVTFGGRLVRKAL